MSKEEPIIIDGVDVSECKHHRKCILPDNIGCKIDDFLCCDKPNCYFKQLIRKTQECEALKSESFTMNSLIIEQEEEIEELKAYAQRQESQREEYYKEYLKLSQQCEELKKELDLYKTWYRAKHGDVKNLLGCYRKALDEIDKVCLEDTRTFADGTTVRYDSLDEILDIINKADFGKSEHSETRPGESCVEPVEPPIIQEAKGEE